MNKRRELLEAISERVRIGYFDSPDGSAAFASDKFRYAESFQSSPRFRRAAAQTATGGDHTESNQINSNPAKFNQRNLTSVAEAGAARVRQIRGGDTRRIDEPNKKQRSSFGNFSCGGASR